MIDAPCRTVVPAAALVRAGGVIAYPTEGCFGLGCLPRDLHAVRRILRVKRRHWRQGLILVAARVEQLAAYVDMAQDEPLARALETWPGPHTWLLPARRGVSPWLRGEHERIAVRVTAHPVAAALARHARSALVSTSANRHGEPPARSAAEALRRLGRDVDAVVPGALGELDRPTTITDAVTGRIVR